jgi:hypothetical protein
MVNSVAQEGGLMVAIKKNRSNDNDRDAIPGVDLLTADEGYAHFDQQTRMLLNIPGTEFLRRWDAGDYRPIPDTAEGRNIGRLVMLLPFARRTHA